MRQVTCMQATAPYLPKNKIRIVTAASLFDGHDAAINIMRRIIQASGAEVIHLGHNRSVAEIVNCAIEEDANAIALTSYQGGHLEFFAARKRLRTYKNIRRRRRHHTAFRNRNTARLWYRPDIFAG